MINQVRNSWGQFERDKCLDERDQRIWELFESWFPKSSVTTEDELVRDWQTGRLRRDPRIITKVAAKMNVGEQTVRRALKHRWSCLPDNEKFQSEIEHYENMEVMFGWTLEHLKNFEYEFMDPALDILMYMRQILTSCIRLESESKVTNYLKMNWQTNLENLLDVGRARVRELQEYEKLLRAQIAAIRMGNQGLGDKILSQQSP